MNEEFLCSIAWFFILPFFISMTIDEYILQHIDDEEII